MVVIIKIIRNNIEYYNFQRDTNKFTSLRVYIDTLYTMKAAEQVLNFLPKFPSPNSVVFNLLKTEFSLNNNEEY